MTMPGLLQRIFRANPEYELLPMGALNGDERSALGDLKEDESCFGVLRPKQSGLRPVKAICRDTARLWRDLQRPSQVPQWVGEDARATTAVAQLVLDGVLAVEAANAFVTGAEARELICGATDDDPSGVLSRLSQRALVYAQSLDIDSAVILAGRLYCYGRIPIASKWSNRFRTGEALRADFQIGREWQPGTPREGWLTWRSRIRSAAMTDGAVAYKLYVSPMPDDVFPAVRALAKAAANHGAHHFKAGQDASGLLRPDKMVAYFGRRHQVDAAAAEIASELAGCRVHGVPFSAEVAGDGLVSWGIDPPSHAWHRGESWRLWLAKRLAAALIDARRAGAEEPWRYALNRVRLDGVDPVTWTPAQVSELAWSA